MLHGVGLAPGIIENKKVRSVLLIITAYSLGAHQVDCVHSSRRDGEAEDDIIIVVRRMENEISNRGSTHRPGGR
jgi:GT2 family glycosyltransferase